MYKHIEKNLRIDFIYFVSSLLIELRPKINQTLNKQFNNNNKEEKIIK